MDTKLALDVRSLSVFYKVYEGLLKVIPCLDLFVKQGERVGLVGETGCGKTTVLKAVANILKYTPAIVNKEKIEVYGKNIEDKAGIKIIKRNVSMIFQDPATSLNPTIKVSSQMSDVLKYFFPHENKKTRYEKMMHALESVLMPAPERVLDSYPIQLSGGMRQRVCIAISLLKEPILIMADEPTTALDVTIEEQILVLLDKLVREQKRAMILVSHALGAVRKTTDRVYVMYAGNIVEVGKTEDIFRSPKHPYTIGLIAATPKLTGEGIADGIAGNIPSYVNPPKGCRFAPRCKRASSICLEKQPILEQKTINDDLRQVACHHV